MDGMTLVVEVTQEDIDKGVGRNCLLCPVALAVRRASGLGIMADVEVSPFRIRVVDGDTRWEARTPEDVADFISDFDERWGYAGSKPKPFRTTLTFKKIHIG